MTVLSEAECRIFHQPSIQDAFIHDLDTPEAADFLETAGYFDEEQVEMIRNRASRLEKYREFLRAYKRKCSSFAPIFQYFDFSGQEHLKNMLQEGLPGSRFLKLDRLPSATKTVPDNMDKLLKRKLLMGNVPTSRHLIKREITNQLAEALRENSVSDGFIVAVHGCAGAGKTSLVAQCLEDHPDLLTQHYDSVIWIPDSGETKKKLHTFQMDLLMLLREDLDFSCEKMVSPKAVKEMVIDALLDWPNVLIVVDEVINEECLLWLDRLNCRIVITTRDVDFLRSAATLPLRKLEVLPMNQGEITAYLQYKGISGSFCDKVYEATDGIPALICQLITLADGRDERLSDICELLRTKGMDALRCRSLYKHESMSDTLRQSLRNTPESLQDALIWSAFMPVSIWTPVEVWMQFIPVDVEPHSSLKQEVEIVLSRLARLSWILEKRTDQVPVYRTLATFSAFLKGEIDPEQCKRAREIMDEKLQKVSDGETEADGTSSLDQPHHLRNFGSALKI